MKRKKILITGASGQLGFVLTKALQFKYGIKNIIATDINFHSSLEGHFEFLDVTDLIALKQMVVDYKVSQIYHLAAILSAKGEKDPIKTWDINIKTLTNVLEVSRLNNVKKVFFPSSIAVFGNNILRINTPQNSNLSPSTMYGVTKVAGENLANYYFQKYGIDVRSLRYPGIIGHQSLPGGGTTDYAVEIYHKAVRNENFECFLEPFTMLPMIYIDDAVRATIELMEAPSQQISIRTSYNLAGMSFSPKDLVMSIRKSYPYFQVNYKPDFRQEIANTWPVSIDDSKAVQDWDWQPEFDLNRMTKDMIANLKKQLLTTK
ncbi:NAD-dependent epimerase/dehydratase family protein [Tamlana fucoidanivorans]|uniref:NAD-dependent epimerase/dehydratase family protein n=1 Tax=Allotamlana fucoidanivorans TaxID=2583814 RepID=A0A5C4SRI9_9FLAO|nr:NAD-dependent epimerase/dehydratase family protein [Tamlana fucoidanivorans]TNJ46952.1 NAD-dependent epimerase/dehydratase family protein [Tamlana fucoidanivorans]